MPRGVAKYTLDQQIERTEIEIAEEKKRLSELKAKLAELKEKKKSKEIKELQMLISENELSVTDVKEYVLEKIKPAEE